MVQGDIEASENEASDMVEQQRPRDDGRTDGATHRGRGALRRARRVWRRIVDAATTAADGVVGVWSPLPVPAVVPIPVRVTPRAQGRR